MQIAVLLTIYAESWLACSFFFINYVPRACLFDFLKFVILMVSCNCSLPFSTLYNQWSILCVVFWILDAKLQANIAVISHYHNDDEIWVAAAQAWACYFRLWQHLYHFQFSDVCWILNCLCRHVVPRHLELNHLRTVLIVIILYILTIVLEPSELCLVRPLVNIIICIYLFILCSRANVKQMQEWSLVFIVGGNKRVMG